MKIETGNMNVMRSSMMGARPSNVRWNLSLKDMTVIMRVKPRFCLSKPNPGKDIMTGTPHVASHAAALIALDHLWVSRRPRWAARTKGNAIYRMMFDGREARHRASRCRGQQPAFVARCHHQIIEMCRRKTRKAIYRTDEL